MASGSRLDPDVTPQVALFQIDRIAQARGLSLDEKSALREWVKTKIQKPDFGIFGEERVNVLMLNLDLDKTFPGYVR